MAVLPWSTFFLMLMNRRISENKPFLHCLLAISLSLAALVFCHPFTSLFFYPIFIVMTAFMSIGIGREYRNKFLLAGIISVICGAVFSSPYWFSAFQLKEYVDYASAIRGYFNPADHVVYFHQLFSRTWGYGDSIPGPGDGMPFQLGLPHFIVALAGFWLNRKNMFFLSAFILYVVCIFLMSPLSAPVWKNAPLIGMIQFPWRLLSVISVLQIICSSGLFRISKDLHMVESRYRMILSSAVVITLIWNFNQFKMVKVDNRDIRSSIEALGKMRLEFFEVLEETKEFLPKTAVKYQPSRPRGKGPMIEVADPACIIEEYQDSNPHHMRYKITNSKPQFILINQLYFPGWKVAIGDKAYDDSYLLEHICMDGRIQVEIPTCESMYFEAYYEGPPGWYARNIIICVLFIAILTLIILEQKRSSSRCPCC